MALQNITVILSVHIAVHRQDVFHKDYTSDHLPTSLFIPNKNLWAYYEITGESTLKEIKM